MARVRAIHWKEEESAALLKTLRKAGHQVDYEERPQVSFIKLIRETMPAAIVIDLSRSPSHGRWVGVVVRGTKSTRHIPIVYVGGEPEKVDRIRELMPDASYTTMARLPAALKRALAKPVIAPVVPPGMMELSKDRTAAQKIGIRAGMHVGLVDPPPDYVRVLGKLPEEVVLEEEPSKPCPITLWFVRDPAEFLAELPRKRALAAKTRLWIVWQKGQRGADAINANVIMENAAAMGLAQYKICSVNPVWTGMVFTIKKA